MSGVDDRSRLHSCPAADSHDPSALLLPHVGNHRAQDIEGGPQVEIHHGIPRGIVGLVDGSPAGKSPGNVDQRVDALKLLERVGHAGARAGPRSQPILPLPLLLFPAQLLAQHGAAMARAGRRSISAGACVHGVPPVP